MAANVPCLPASWLSLWPRRNHVGINRILFIVSTGQPRQKPLVKASSSPRAVRRCSFAVEGEERFPGGGPARFGPSARVAREKLREKAGHRLVTASRCSFAGEGEKKFPGGDRARQGPTGGVGRGQGKALTEGG